MYRRNSNRFFVGILLIALGGLFLSHELGYTSWNIGELFRTFWPVFLIFFGIKGLFAQRQYGYGGSSIWSAFMVLLGGMFLAKNLGYFGNRSYGDLFKFFGPGFLILIGLSMMFRPHRPMRRRDFKYDYRQKDPYDGEPAPYEYNRDIPHPDEFNKQPGDAEKERPSSAVPGRDREQRREERRERREQRRYERSQHDYSYWNGKENHSSFFGDLHLGQDYWELKPMNISHFVGDTVLDLTKAQIPYGETKVVVSAFIGDVKIFIPNDMQVEVSVVSSSFLGDIRVFDRHEGGFMRNLRLESPNYADADKKIKLIVSMFIGDVNVQRVG